MDPILVHGPAVEPVTVLEIRAWLRLDDAAEDAVVAALIMAARLAVETAARRILIESRWRAVVDAWPAGRVVRLPMSPVIAVDTVEVVDAAGVAHALAASACRIDVASDPARLFIDTSAPEPGITRAGSQSNSAPASVRPRPRCRSPSGTPSGSSLRAGSSTAATTRSPGGPRCRTMS